VEFVSPVVTSCSLIVPVGAGTTVSVFPAEAVTIPVICTPVSIEIPVEDIAVNVALVAPCGTTTVAGTVTAELALDSVTVVPDAGAGVVKITVPVELCPEMTAEGLKYTSLKSGAGGVIVSITCCEDVPRVAVIVAICCVLTGSVVTTNPALVLPCGTVTVIPGCARFVSLCSVTVAPGAGAGFTSVTVPSTEFPPTIDVAARVTLIS